MLKDTEPPSRGRRFYCIIPNGDGTADVYLNPDPRPITDSDGFTDYSPTAIVVRDVDPDDDRFNGDLEGHIRANFKAWCKSGRRINL